MAHSLLDERVELRGDPLPRLRTAEGATTAQVDGCGAELVKREDLGVGDSARVGVGMVLGLVLGTYLVVV